MVPIGATVISGFTTLSTVPGVEEGIVFGFAGIVRTGIFRLSLSSDGSITLPAPVLAPPSPAVPDVSILSIAGTLGPAPTILTGPKQILPVL